MKFPTARGAKELGRPTPVIKLGKIEKFMTNILGKIHGTETGYHTRLHSTTKTTARIASKTKDNKLLEETSRRKYTRLALKI